MPLFRPNALSREWLEQDIPEFEYQKILNYEMKTEQTDYKPVFTIRSPKSRPDGKAKTEYWEWANLPAFAEANPEWCSF